MTPLDQLRLHLRDLAPGSVKDTSTLSDVLESAWGVLQAGDIRGLGMEASKLFGRMENVEWNPPVLTFRIERHGGIVAGASKRAELQEWEVDAEAGTVTGGQVGFRQLKPQAAPLSVAPLVDKAVALIQDHQKHEWLKWVSDTRVRLLIAKIIPATNPQTTSGRRTRFRAELEPRLETLGFKRPPGSAPNTYERIPLCLSGRGGRRS